MVSVKASFAPHWSWIANVFIPPPTNAFRPHNLGQQLATPADRETEKGFQLFSDNKRTRRFQAHERSRASLARKALGCLRRSLRRDNPHSFLRMTRAFLIEFKSQFSRFLIAGRRMTSASFCQRMQTRFLLIMALSVASAPSALAEPPVKLDRTIRYWNEHFKKEKEHDS